MPKKKKVRLIKMLLFVVAKKMNTKQSRSLSATEFNFATKRCFAARSPMSFPVVEDINIQKEINARKLKDHIEKLSSPYDTSDPALAKITGFDVEFQVSCHEWSLLIGLRLCVFIFSPFFF